MSFTDRHPWVKQLPLILAVIVLAVMGTLYLTEKDPIRAERQAAEDTPPVIEFTWRPLGPVDLRQMVGYLTMRDDYGLDFTTYRFRIVELDKTLDLPIQGMVGKDYEDTIHLGYIADDPRLLDKDRITLQFSIADDKGQRTSIERVVRLRREVIIPTLTK